jgi:hypothetical protein
MVLKKGKMKFSQKTQVTTAKNTTKKMRKKRQLIITKKIRKNTKMQQMNKDSPAMKILPIYLTKVFKKKKKSQRKTSLPKKGPLIILNQLNIDS